MIKKNSMLTLIGLIAMFQLSAVHADSDVAKQVDSAKTLGTAQAFLWAAGSGDADKLDSLMSDDFVWHNEGDSNIPWIGNWQGKETVFNSFLPKFGAGLKVTSWTTDYSFANGEQAVFMGTMSAIANESGIDTGKFSWAVRVHVVDGKVKSWNWFEDSYAVSKAYHAK
ncbi:nuclear transport factor 2 family protein [Agarivorans sp. Alg241-V36]|uniref:nuclear transport factor 2 family protein n=1 Tax=Agarivorans sp. Alg241-V36 TaxID=2305992 RepID=UPI0013D741C1|nr:nuclear transport factor 2 family protein [Agarivorans sp. Alg241-V36]